MLEIFLLGQFQLKLDGREIALASRPAQSLIAYLALNPNRTHRRERVAGLLWPDVEESSARANLRQALWKIHKAFEAERLNWRDYLRVNEISIELYTACPIWVDAAQIEQKSGELRSVEELERSVSPYHGELLPGFYDEWAVLDRERLRAVFDKKMGMLLDLLLEHEQWDEAVRWAEHWIAQGQFPVPAYRALLFAAAGQGDSAGLRVVYRRARDACQRELESEPPQEITEVYQRALTTLSQPTRAERQGEVRQVPVTGDGCAEAQERAVRRQRILIAALLTMMMVASFLATLVFLP